MRGMGVRGMAVRGMAVRGMGVMAVRGMAVRGMAVVPHVVETPCSGCHSVFACVGTDTCLKKACRYAQRTAGGSRM